jgi:hypothetical protein
MTPLPLPETARLDPRAQAWTFFARGPLALASAALACLALAGCADSPDSANPSEDMPGASSVSLTPIIPPAGPGAGMPFVAAGDDRFYLSWTEPTGEEGPSGNPVHAVRFASIDARGEGAWSEPRTLAASDRFFVNWADFPSIATGSDGRLAAHWLARSGEGTYDYDVVVSTSTDDGESWSEPRVMHADGVAAEHGFLSFFPLEEGFGAVWLDGRETTGGHDEGGAGGAMTLRGGVVDWSGTPRDLHLLDDRICDCCQTDAALVEGGVVAVYRDRSESEIRDISAVRYMDGAWEAPRPVHADNWEIPACPVNGPAVAARGREVVTAWFTGADDVARVRVAFSTDAGATWAPPVEVDEGAPMGRVDVVLLESGSALVVWLEATEDDAAVMARQVHPDGRLGPASPLALTSQVRASGFPRMALHGDRVLVSWSEPSATRGGPSTLRAAWLELGES